MKSQALTVENGKFLDSGKLFQSQYYEIPGQFMTLKKGITNPVVKLLEAPE